MTISAFSVIPNSQTGQAAFAANMDTLLGELPSRIAQANADIAALNALAAGFTSRASATSFTLATGSKAFTLATTGALFPIGTSVKIARTSDGTKWAHGDVTAFADPVLTVNVTTLNGTGGPWTDWTISTSAPIAPNGYKLLDAQTISAQASVSLETTLDATYDYYVAVGADIVVSADAATLVATLKLGGSYASANYYYHNQKRASGSGVYDSDVSASAASIPVMTDLGAGASESARIVIDIIGNPASTALEKALNWRGSRVNSGVIGFTGEGGNTGTGALTGVKLTPSTGTISGRFYLYGVTKS